jgi:hypothetical protein
MTRQQFSYRWNYVVRCFWRFFGRCPHCHGPVNYTMRGRPICPKCGK